MVLYFIQKHKKLPHNHTIHTETVQSDKWIGQQPHAHWQLRDTGVLSPGGVTGCSLYPCSPPAGAKHSLYTLN